MRMQMKIVFNCFSMISSAVGAEVSLTYAVHLLDPLYKVSEGFAGKVISGMIFVSIVSKWENCIFVYEFLIESFQMHFLISSSVGVFFVVGVFLLFSVECSIYIHFHPTHILDLKSCLYVCFSEKMFAHT